MTNLCVRYVVYRYGHHSPHSGYSRLAEYGKEYFNADLIKVSKPVSKSIIRDRILWRLSKGTPGYNRASIAAELAAMWHLLKESNYIYHFLYGETTYHYAGTLNNFRHNRIVATFHLPPQGIRNAVQISWQIKQLSAIICVGSSQKEYFEDFFDQERIFCIPLGIDTQYYLPPAEFESRDPNLCLVVGENYRDFPTLRGVIELVAYIRPKTKFIVVTSQNSSKMLGQHPNLSIKSGIPESELLNLYQTAALMISPLQDTTANNAILESISCGLPVITSDVGSIRDYLTSQCAVLIPPNDARKMAQTITALLDENGERKKMSEKSREQALRFSWFEVMKKLETVYSSLP
jgi:glycosyltransferase involved in cell wall biosynthesis